MKVIICDFGFARELGKYDRADTLCGTPYYMAPEIKEEPDYDYGVDIWALGIIYFELLTGTVPFRGETLKELDKNVLKGFYSIDLQNIASLECILFLSDCL